MCCAQVRTTCAPPRTACATCGVEYLEPRRKEKRVLRSGAHHMRPPQTACATCGVAALDLGTSNTSAAPRRAPHAHDLKQLPPRASSLGFLALRFQGNYNPTPETQIPYHQATHALRPGAHRMRTTSNSLRVCGSRPLAPSTSITALSAAASVRYVSSEKS